MIRNYSRFLTLAAAFSAVMLHAQPAQNADWHKPFPAFRIAGNLYYVGTADLAAYVLHTPQGDILINGAKVDITNPRDAKALGIETIYQTLALADNVDAAANLYLGRELRTRWGTLDDVAMEAECRQVMGRLNPNFRRFKEPVKALSGGQRQSVAIARAIHFNARILIMDEPTAALGPQETAQVGELIKQLKAEGIGIFLISHDIHDVFDLADRLTVMKNGRVVGTARTTDVDHDEVLGMIIAGKCPPGAIPGPGALQTASAAA